MQVVDVELKQVTFNRGGSPHPSILIYINDKWERFHDGVPVTLSEAEVDQIPLQYFEDGLLTIENVTRSVITK